MMNLLIVVFFSLLFIIGLLMLLSSIAKYSSYVSTQGEIVDYLKCNTKDGPLEALEEEQWTEAEAAMIVYIVGGESFRLATKNKKAWKKSGAKGEVEVFYNPFDPGEAYLREGSPYLGGFIMTASAVGILVVLIF